MCSLSLQEETVKGDDKGDNSLEVYTQLKRLQWVCCCCCGVHTPEKRRRDTFVGREGGPQVPVHPGVYMQIGLRCLYTPEEIQKAPQVLQDFICP